MSFDRINWIDQEPRSSEKAAVGNFERRSLRDKHQKAKDALKWAALTYVVAALAAVVTLVQYIMVYLGSRDRN